MFASIPATARPVHTGIWCLLFHAREALCQQLGKQAAEVCLLIVKSSSSEIFIVRRKINIHRFS